MNNFTLLSCVVAMVFAQKYTDKYDNINIKEILENPRLRMGYKNCLLGLGPCTAEGKELKDNIQEAIEEGCKKCTDKQWEGFEIVVKFLMTEDPVSWKELTDKFDPTGEWRKKYEEEAKKRGIKINF